MADFVIYVRRMLKGVVPCIFHSITGLYCPGCGGTRAVAYLLNGHLLLSFLYHPIVLYTAVVLSYYIIRNVLFAVSHGKICSKAPFRVAFLWIALALILGNLLVKNVALIFFGLDLMPLH